MLTSDFILFFGTNKWLVPETSSSNGPGGYPRDSIQCVKVRTQGGLRSPQECAEDVADTRSWVRY
jgi:hypothetical protein